MSEKFSKDFTRFLEHPFLSEIKRENYEEIIMKKIQKMIKFLKS